MTENKGMDCIVVGGCANGTLLHDVEMDAQYVELRRPAYIKPLASTKQSIPEVEHEKDVYEIHVLGLHDSEISNPVVFGIAVIQDKPLTWAFTQLCVSHVENTTAKLMQSGALAGQETRHA